MISPGGLIATLYKSAQAIVAGTDQFFGNVVLLMNGEAIVDNSGAHATVSTVGSAQISTTVFKYGTGSMKFNGSTDYFTLPASTNYNIGTNNFTIECWVYPLAYGGAIAGASLFHANCHTQSGYSLNLGENQSRFRFISRGAGSWADNVVVSAGNGPALNTWTHVAAVRNGTSLKLYINGVERGSTTIVPLFSLAGSGTQATVGYFSDGGTARFLNGYIDDLRVTNGIARYTGNFTPPTEPLAP